LTEYSECYDIPFPTFSHIREVTADMCLKHLLIFSIVNYATIFNSDETLFFHSTPVLIVYPMFNSGELSVPSTLLSIGNAMVNEMAMVQALMKFTLKLSTYNKQIS
jgi:hypothetical protein